jgi:nucleoside-diphosphate-sugar epimerase
MRERKCVPTKIFAPSYLVGKGDEFSSIFRAALDSGRIYYPGDGNARIQPVHIGEFCSVITSFVEKRHNFDFREAPVLGEPIRYRSFLENTARLVSPNLKIGKRSLEECMAEAVASQNPEFSTSELAILLADKVGVFRPKVYGASISNWAQLLEKLSKEYDFQ